MQTTTNLRPSVASGLGRVGAVSPAGPLLAARHFISKLAFETDPSDLAADLEAGVAGLVVVDTRQPEAFATSHLPGAVNLPHNMIDEQSTDGLDPEALYVTYCWGPACNASTRGAANLASLGYRVKELTGGLEAWQAEGYPVEGTTDVTSLPTEGSCAC